VRIISGPVSLALLLTAFTASSHLITAQEVSTAVAKELPSILDTYKDLHAHPELSHHEERTSTYLATELRRSGYTVTEHIGRYPTGKQAYGIVAILKNGPGPHLLIRADMDALPIVEETGLSYASHVTTKTEAGQDTGVMHACGHDVHVSVLIGTARALASMRDKWHGTLMLVGQTSEVTIDGAKAMLADHIYERFGKPDLAIALHDTNTLPAGTVGIATGPALASSTSVDVTIRGIGGHGSAPELGKDPIVIAAAFIQQIQTIVSRQISPQDPAVVTVGKIEGGTRRNIIPNQVKLELTCRAFSEKARQSILNGLRNAAQGEAIAAGVPTDLLPTVTVLDDESTAVTYNDPTLAARVRSALVTAVGDQHVVDTPAIMGSEDFGILSLRDSAPKEALPSVLFWLGASNPQKLAEAQSAGKALPGLHTNRFEPDPEPTLRTGITAMTTTAIALLQP